MIAASRRQSRGDDGQDHHHSGPRQARQQQGRAPGVPRHARRRPGQRRGAQESRADRGTRPSRPSRRPPSTPSSATSSSTPASSPGWSTKACDATRHRRPDNGELPHEHRSRLPDKSLAVDRRRVFLGLPVLAAGAAWPHGAALRRRALRVHRHPPPDEEVDGIKIFYREAGPQDAPVVLLLHGFPTSSHMFRNLIPALADRYHVIAPDYPGYGQSDMPDRAKFAYTFDRFGELVDGLLDQTRRLALRDVRHGLRRAGGLAIGPEASRAHHRAHRAERQRL